MTVFYKKSIHLPTVDYYGHEYTSKGKYVSYTFCKRGFIEFIIFLISEGNKILFTHITVYYMRTKYEENLLKIRKII